MSYPDLLQTLNDLEQHYPRARGSSASKVSSSLTPAMQIWLTHSPFFVMATSNADSLDCSPRGDAAGEAFRMLDENTLAIPDRRGNNRIDSLRNLLLDPRVALLFLIPGTEEALRVKGTASICVNQELRDSFAINDEKPPSSVILIDVHSAYVQNARAIRRSKLWESDKKNLSASIPDAAELSKKV